MVAASSLTFYFTCLQPFTLMHRGDLTGRRPLFRRNKLLFRFEEA